jgi:hypothetical protein
LFWINQITLAYKFGWRDEEIADLTWS